MTDLRGVTHRLTMDTPRGPRTIIATVCEACEHADPALRDIRHTAYIGVDHGLHDIRGCSHPQHDGPCPCGAYQPGDCQCPHPAYHAEHLDPPTPGYMTRR